MPVLGSFMHATHLPQGDPLPKRCTEAVSYSADVGIAAFPFDQDLPTLWQLPLLLRLDFEVANQSDLLDKVTG